MSLLTEMFPAAEGPTLAMAKGWCQQVWRSSLAPDLHHAFASPFVAPAKSKGWSPNDPNGLLVTLGLASNRQQQAQHTDLPLYWEGLKWAAGRSLACSCTPDDSLKCCLPTVPWSWLWNDLSQKKILVPRFYEAGIWLPHLGRGQKKQTRRRGAQFIWTFTLPPHSTLMKAKGCFRPSF